MHVLRKIALALLLTASAGVLLLASLELWNYRQWAYLPLSEPGVNLNGRARILQDRMEVLTKRVGDMELLVLILLGTSGLYAIVFVASSYFSATSFARQADHTIGQIQDQIGLAMGDLRELQEDTELRLHQMTAPATISTSPPVSPPATPDASAVQLPERPKQTDASAPQRAEWVTQLAEITARVSGWRDRTLSEHTRMELVQDENTAAYVDAMAGARQGAANGSALGSALADLYFAFGRIYTASDSARSRFYLERALRLVDPESPLASEVHYLLACRFAASSDFPRAMRELAAAFEHEVKALDERLASDIEEGGRLYELASTPPFDKAVNDLLLNMSIGIG
jgi:hypothetical protein